jgi:hypothetical protein
MTFLLALSLSDVRELRALGLRIVCRLVRR